MGIFDLEDWRSLWNLNKPPKSYRSQYSNSSVYTGLNRSHGDLSQRRYMARKEHDELDGRSYNSLGRQLSKSSDRRGGSLPPPTTRRGSNQAPPRIHNANGMVESISKPDNVRTVLPAKKQPATASPVNANHSSSESTGSKSPVRQTPPGPQRPVSRILPGNDSAWIKSRKELDSSLEFVDNNSSPAPRPQGYAAKEPVKNWEKQLNRKSTENLNKAQKDRYEYTARSSARNVSGSDDGQPTTFSEARRKFQQLAQASAARQTEDYNEPLRLKFISQQNISDSNSVAQMKQYQSAVGLDDYDYPKKNAEIRKRESLYNRANSSGLPEPVRSGASHETQSARSAKPATNIPITGRNLPLLGLSSDNSEAEASDTLVTSTPRSSTRKSKSRENISDPDWDTLDIVLKRSKKNSEGLGFVIRGGLDEEVRPGDPQIYVSQIEPGQVAALDGRLRVGDIIIAVNGSDMKSMSHKTASRLLSVLAPSVRLTIKRFVGKVHIKLVTLVKNGKPLGLTVTGGVGNEVHGGGTAIYVKDINPKGVAYSTGAIEIGDQIQKVNNRALSDVSHHFATECLRNAGDPVALVIAKTGRINPLLFSKQ